MSLNFLHPEFFVAVAAVGLPFLVHLLSRKRVQPVRFSAVRFILLSQKRVAKKYRLKNLLLLILRTLAVLALILLAIHPVLQSGGSLWGSSGSRKRVIILDNSYSMGLDRDTFSKAKEIAKELLSMGSDSATAVLASQQGAPAPVLSNYAHSLETLKGIGLSYGGADLLSAFQRAFESVGRVGADREIVLISDLAEGGWQAFNLTGLNWYDPAVGIRIIAVAPERSGPNAAVQSIEMKTQVVAEGQSASLIVKGVNFSDHEAKNLLLQLFVDEKKIDQKIFTVGPSGEWRQEFHVKFDRAGIHSGLVRLEGEGLIGGGDHHFTMEVKQRVNAYLVDGDPKMSLVQSETFFLARALHPEGAASSSVIDLEVISPDELGRVVLSKTGVIFLCNLPVVDGVVKQKLVEYVRKGGGIFFFSGDQMRVEAINRLLFETTPPLLPSRILEMKRAAQGGERIGAIEKGHPVLSIFDAEELSSPRFHTYFQVDSPLAGAKTLLKLEGGDPLLIEQQVGEGRVMLFTSTADREWSDFSIKASYVPFVQGVARYLAGVSAKSILPDMPVGGKKRFTVERRYAGSLGRVLLPDKKERDIVFKAIGDSAEATFEEHPVPGSYRLSLPGKSLVYAVNPPMEELDAKAISEDLIRAKFQPAEVTIERVGPGGLSHGTQKNDLSPILLLLFAAVLAVEGVVSHRT